MPVELEQKCAYGNVHVLYTMHMFFAFVSRMWEIGIVLLVAALTNNSLYIVALSGLISSASLFLFAPSLGSWFDKHDRLYAMKAAIAVKIISVTTGYALCAHMLGSSDTIAVVNGLEIYAVPIICALANLAFAMVTMSVEKDWVVILSGGDANWLSSTNSMMTQIDLACNAVAPAVTGVLFSFFSYRIVALVLLGLNAATAMGLYFYLNRLYISWPALMRTSYEVQNTTGGANTALVSSEPLEAADVTADSVSSPPPTPPTLVSAEERKKRLSGGSSRSDNTAEGSAETTPSFLRSGVAGTMIAYSCLYFTVLSFSPLMLVYLRWSGLEEHWVGTARGISAIAGFFGAFIYPYARSLFGVVLTGQLFIWYQCGLVTTAALAILLCRDSTTGVKIMVMCVLASRIGLWAFDLSARQIAQEGIAERHRGAVNGKWRSLTAFFDLSSYIVAVLFPNPENFWILTSVSAVMVFAAAMSFTISTAPSLAYCNNKWGYSSVSEGEHADHAYGKTDISVPFASGSKKRRQSYGTSEA